MNRCRARQGRMFGTLLGAGALVLAHGASSAETAAPDPFRVAQSPEVSNPVLDLDDPSLPVTDRDFVVPGASGVDAPEPAQCAAIAVDADVGALGNGLGGTLETARGDALTKCREDGGRVCTVTSSACSPDASAGTAQ